MEVTQAQVALIRVVHLCKRLLHRHHTSDLLLDGAEHFDLLLLLVELTLDLFIRLDDVV